MIIVAVLTALLAFAAGYWLGRKSRSHAPAETAAPKPGKDAAALEKQYLEFLRYGLK